MVVEPKELNPLARLIYKKVKKSQSRHFCSLIGISELLTKLDRLYIIALSNPDYRQLMRVAGTPKELLKVGYKSKCRSYQQISPTQKKGISRDFKKAKNYLKTTELILEELEQIPKHLLKDVRKRTTGLKKATERLLAKWRRKFQSHQVVAMIDKILETQKKLEWINTAIWYAYNSHTGLQVKYPRQVYYNKN